MPSSCTHGLADGAHITIQRRAASLASAVMLQEPLQPKQQRLNAMNGHGDAYEAETSQSKV